MKKLLTVCLTLLLLAALSTALAAPSPQLDESTAKGEITLRLVVPELTQSAANQTAELVLLVDQNIQIGSVGLNIRLEGSEKGVIPDKLRIQTPVSGSQEITGAFAYSAVMASCFSGAYLPYDEVLDGYVLLRIPVTVYAGASGDFFFGITIDDLCDADYGEGYVVSDAPLTATLHVEATEEAAVIESAYAVDGEAVCEVSAAEPGVVFIAAFDSDGCFLGCFSQQLVPDGGTFRMDLPEDAASFTVFAVSEEMRPFCASVETPLD